MAEKDIAEKTLEAYNDVFADIINVLLFNGNTLVKEDELEEENPNSSYKADNKLHAQERDIAKYWRKGLVRIAFYGVENQTTVDVDMPLRLFGYDGAAYRSQLLKKEQDESITDDKVPRYPVITLVLYFGYEQRWKTPRSLYDCLNIPEELMPYVNDYKMNLFEIAYLSDEQVQMFQSDFRIVADYFVQMRKNRDYKAPATTITHVHELLQLMSVMTKDSRFEDAYNQEIEGGNVSMCEVLDRVEKKGFNEGQFKGRGEVAALVQFLIDHDRQDDLKKLSDADYRDKLIDELLLNNH